MTLNTRRGFLGQVALGSLLKGSGTDFAPKAKSIIYLHMSGGPSQIDLFDPKPQLTKFQGQDLPASIRKGQRITGMTSGQSTLPVASSVFKFGKYGQSGAEFSELLPFHQKIADDICIVRSLNTDAINHDPAITFIQTGFQQPGRPCFGSWVSYGLGSENKNLPAFVVMISQKSGHQCGPAAVQPPLVQRLSAFQLPGR